MMLTAATVAPPSYYEGLADELELIANSVRKHPELKDHFADRLEELSKQLREDIRLMRAVAVNRPI